MKALTGYTVAIIATNLFEEVELTSPKEALEHAGATVHIVAPNSGSIHGAHHDQKSDAFPVDVTLDEADPADYQAVLLPGGTFNADQLRVNELAQDFVRRIDESGKPIAVICHGAWLLVSAVLVEGRTLTSYHTLEDDIRNAGGNWVDKEVVVDQNWVSSRQPRDLPSFNREMIRLFSKKPVEA